ncbi:uncharacterized protein LOC133178749 isoform X1 [Saccostrea echinata]|uniref:uncharacterized protein LOC133178749 isoform X1 n=1 Tax=Saccostrea echinata TaxID=191078 RepID=UPI002A824C51|nr:uncharacterized protein LOC133178749 isoform X1 [Saccostrea echinata]
MADELCHEDIIEDTVNNGLQAMVLALGYRVGIIDAMQRLNTPCTAAEISEEAQLNLRYVEEWLICMSSKRIVHYEDGRYKIPCSKRVQKAVHTSAVLPIFASCFTNLENVMKNKNTNTGYTYPVEELEWLAKYRKLSNIDQSWIKRNIAPVISNYLRERETVPTILDFGCGYGKLAEELATYYPQFPIFGTDIDVDAIKNCCKSLKHLQFAIFSKDIEKDWQENFDIIILMDVLHDLPDPVTVLTQVKRLLKPNGYIITFDPNISSDISKNIGQKMAMNQLPYSMFFCLPNSLSEKPAAGHGTSWGIEDRKQFFTDNGFTILNIDKNAQLVEEHFRIILQK